MKVLFLPKHEYLGASSRYRTLQYLPYIKEQGIEFDVSPLFSDEYLKYKYKYQKENKLITIKRIFNRIKTILFTAKKYDVLVIEKELIPYLPPFLEYYLKIRNITYIVDYDDAVWHNYDTHKRWVVKKLFVNKIKYVMRNSFTVTVGSEYILEYAKNSRAKKIVKIPTVIDMTKYTCKDKSRKRDGFIIGWIGSPSTSQYILNINNELMNFTKNHNTIVHLVGFDKKLESKLQFNYKIIQWTEDSEVLEICKFDVGIMPLPDTFFEKGKCGFKLIQYMGCKKPVIASNVGENKIIVENNVNGFLVENKSDWVKYLEFFYKNQRKGKEFGLVGCKKIDELYSLEKNQIKYYKNIKLSGDGDI